MPNTVQPSMTAKEFRAALRALGFDSMAGNEGAQTRTEGLSAVARLVGRRPLAGYKWGQDGPPAYVALLLRLMLAQRIDYPQLLKILEAQAKRR